MRNEQQSQPDNSARIAAAVVLFTLRSLAVTLDVVMHHGCGARFLGLQAFAPLLIIPFFAILFPGHDPRPLLGFLVLYVVMGLWAQRGSRRANKTLGPAHSFYSGTPRLRLFRLSESIIKRYVEPAVAFAVGLILSAINQPLSAFILLAAFAQCALANSAEAFDRLRAQQLNDSLIEQRNIAERVRRLNNGQF